MSYTGSLALKAEPKIEDWIRYSVCQATEDIKGFESNILVSGEIRRDQRQEDQLGDQCNKIIRVEIKAEVRTKEIQGAL